MTLSSSQQDNTSLIHLFFNVFNILLIHEKDDEPSDWSLDFVGTHFPIWMALPVKIQSYLYKVEEIASV